MRTAYAGLAPLTPFLHRIRKIRPNTNASQLFGTYLADRRSNAVRSACFARNGHWFPGGSSPFSNLDKRE